MTDKPTRIAALEAQLADETLAARLYEIGNQVHNIATENQNNEGLASRLAGIASQIWSIASEATPPAPKVTGCATEGCAQVATAHFEPGDVGSDYCHGCYMRIRALTAAQEAGKP